MRYTLLLLATLAACFGMQTLALRVVGGHTVKSESNFFSSIGRIQAGTQGKVEVMVLGSSITGRLPDRAQGYAGVANMGCDGGSAVDVLHAIDKGILPKAPWLVIEANTLHLAFESKPTAIGQALQCLWFRAGTLVPQLSAYARPSAFIYSPLLDRRIGYTSDASGDKDLGVASRPHALANGKPAQLAAQQEDLIEEITRIIRKLHREGVRTVIVWMPPARDASSPPVWILELCRRSESYWWDLGQEAKLGTVALTDGVHMSSGSAFRTMESLSAGILDVKSHESARP